MRTHITLATTTEHAAVTQSMILQHKVSQSEFFYLITALTQGNCDTITLFGVFHNRHNSSKI